MAVASRGACRDDWLLRPLRQLAVAGLTPQLVDLFATACGFPDAYSRDVALLALGLAHVDAQRELRPT
jgi:hypothetical protein